MDSGGARQQDRRVWPDSVLPMVISVLALAILFIFWLRADLNGPVSPGPEYDPFWVAWMPEWATFPILAIFALGTLAAASHNFYHWCTDE